MIRQRKSSRRAVAAIELALVTAGVLIPLLFGVWEIGRLIQVKQVVANAAREGARLAAQGYTISDTGAVVQVTATSGATNVKDTVYQYLYSMGLKRLQPADVTTTFAFTAPGSQNGSQPADPYLGDKGQPLSVSVSVQWAKVRWINAGVINPTTISAVANWEMLRDDPFTVNTTLPSW
ncbi:MAG: pilus assembly protein [Planctomycetes bacterium]|nr:pilus assembly protein [Planctomycetota bacterium]